MKTLPLPGSLLSVISPPSRPTSSRQIESPSPVPPYLRLVVPSPCAKASKIDRCMSWGIPIPVSVTLSATTPSAAVKLSRLQPDVTGAARNSTFPLSVNLKALLSRLLRICCSRCGSVGMDFGIRGSSSMVKASLVTSATCRNVRSSSGSISDTGQSLISSATVPDSIFEMSRMSLISFRRSLPDDLMIVAYSTCFGSRLPSGFSASSWARIRRLFRGVRSSWDMLARNSDL